MSECACNQPSTYTLALPCAGGSNVGQISNSAAIELDKQGVARIYCLIGIAAHIPGMVDAAKSASGIIAIDGCPVGCAKAALDHLKLPVSQQIVVTELGIEKNHIFTLSSG
jgi:uncharacterized metal-binding protein